MPRRGGRNGLRHMAQPVADQDRRRADRPQAGAQLAVSALGAPASCDGPAGADPRGRARCCRSCSMAGAVARHGASQMGLGRRLGRAGRSRPALIVLAALTLQGAGGRAGALWRCWPCWRCARAACARSATRTCSARRSQSAGAARSPGWPASVASVGGDRLRAAAAVGLAARAVTPVIGAHGARGAALGARGGRCSRRWRRRRHDGADGGAARWHLTLLREDAQLRCSSLVRGLLTVTALAPPYFVLLGGEGNRRCSGWARWCWPRRWRRFVELLCLGPRCRTARRAWC